MMIGLCNICKQEKIVQKNTITAELTCGACLRKDHYRNPHKHEECSECHGVKPVAGRGKLGEPFCYNCSRKNPEKHEKCSKCNEVKAVEKRGNAGKPICAKCYRNGKFGTCLSCGENKKIHAIKHCCACYRKRRRKQEKERNRLLLQELLS